jgi:hypothetical protein
VRVELPPGLSAFIAARIANYATEATEAYHGCEVSAVTEFAALPLIRHWCETFGLRADGESVSWHTEPYPGGPEPYPGVRPVEERYDWLTALVEGAKRWPELGALLPARPATAVACRCVGHEAFEARGALCPECCGLRWMVAPGVDSDAAADEAR